MFSAVRPLDLGKMLEASGSPPRKPTERAELWLHSTGCVLEGRPALEALLPGLQRWGCAKESSSTARFRRVWFQRFFL